MNTQTNNTTYSDSNYSEEDKIILLRSLVESGGYIGAYYLEYLDYTQATEQPHRTVIIGGAEYTELYYTTGSPDGLRSQKFGLSRCYDSNGRRAIFTIYRDGQIIETRTYGKDNSTYNAKIIRDTSTMSCTIQYQVEDGKVTRAELTRDGNTISVEFDDTNRPATPLELQEHTMSNQQKRIS